MTRGADNCRVASVCSLADGSSSGGSQICCLPPPPPAEAAVFACGRSFCKTFSARLRRCCTCPTLFSSGGKVGLLLLLIEQRPVPSAHFRTSSSRCAPTRCVLTFETAEQRPERGRQERRQEFQECSRGSAPLSFSSLALSCTLCSFDQPWALVQKWSSGNGYGGGGYTNALVLPNGRFSMAPETE